DVDCPRRQASLEPARGGHALPLFLSLNNSGQCANSARTAALDASSASSANICTWPRRRESRMIFRALSTDRGRMSMRQVWHLAAGHYTGQMELIVPLVGIAPTPVDGTMDPCR